MIREERIERLIAMARRRERRRVHAMIDAIAGRSSTSPLAVARLDDLLVESISLRERLRGAL